MDYYESVKLFNEAKKNLEYDEMKKAFDDRTNMHIGGVKRYIESAIRHYPNYENRLRERAECHDQSKFTESEYEPYVHTNWMYKCEAEDREYEMDDMMKQRCHAATFHHIKNNPHHPEYWDLGLTKNPINYEDRNEASGIVVDGRKMDNVSIVEMMCDWCACCAENKKSPYNWADKQINKRWKFDDKQIALMYNVLDKIW